jgi:hypothetical protein
LSEDKKKVLDVRFPKEQQEKSKELTEACGQKKYQVDVEYPDGKVRYMYGDDPVTLEMYAKGEGLKILRVTKL